MLINTLLLSAALAEEPARPSALAPERFTVGLPVEIALVGLSYGVHPELMYRPFNPDGLFNLRASAGLMVGRELSNMPLSLGVREEFFPRRRVHVALGTGAQLNLFKPRLHPVSPRLDMYYELAVYGEIAKGWEVGVEISPEIGMVPGFGLGMAARVGVQKDLPW